MERYWRVINGQSGESLFSPYFVMATSGGFKVGGPRQD